MPPIFLGLCSGLLAILALRLPFGWPIIFISLIPLLYASQHAKNVYGSAIAGIAAGVIICANGSWWMIEVLPFPVSYAALTPLQGFALVTFCWSVIAVGTGMWIGAWTALLWYMRLDRAWKLFAAVFLFLISLFMSLVTFNAGSVSADVHNPLFYSAGFIGYALADSDSFLQAASLGGVWTLSAIAVFVNLLLYFFLQKPESIRRRNIAFLSIALLVIAILPVASIRERFEARPTTLITVGFMSLGISVHTSETPDALIARGTELVLNGLKHMESSRADIALVPEEDRVFAPAGDVHVKDVVKSNIAVIHGGSVPLSNGRAALSGYVSTASGDTWIRNKLVLVPQGEFLSSSFSGFFHLIGVGNAADHFASTHALTNGEIGNPAIVGPVRAALLFCSELLMPELAKQSVNTQNANLLLIASSHAVFFKTSALEQDTFRFARVQTVEAGVPSVSSVENGSAYALDRYGHMLTSVRAENNDIAVGIAHVLVAK